MKRNGKHISQTSWKSGQSLGKRIEDGKARVQKARSSEPEPLLWMELCERVGWHCDDEPLFGRCGVAKLIVSVSFSTRALFKWKASTVRTVKLARAALVMVTSLSWMANVKTSFFTVRIPVWNRSGLTLRSVGSDNMLLPVPCGQRRFRPLLLRRLWGMTVLGLSWCSLEPCAYGRGGGRRGY